MPYERPPRPAPGSRTPRRRLESLPEPVDYEVESVEIHGHKRSFLRAGQGPVVLLIHGIGDRATTWDAVIPMLARNYTVIAPDLLGHGLSDKPRADYSVAAYACGMRDLLTVLGVESVTIVGHSLGGGVAAQFAYQFPERCERLVLVSSGGIGREVHVGLRALSIPGAEAILPVLVRLGDFSPWPAMLHRLAAGLRKLDSPIAHDADDILEGYLQLQDSPSRRAFIRTLRAVVDPYGQVVTMLDRCYLTQGMPTLLIWGDRDPIIPQEHGYIAHAAMPGSRLEIMASCGHYPHHYDPVGFVRTLRAFIESTESAEYDPSAWREILQSGRPDASTDAASAVTEDALHHVHLESGV